jgi:hypothetical protein
MSDNTFGGPTGAQTGDGNVQHNTFILPPAPSSGPRRQLWTVAAIAAAVVLIGTSVLIATKLSTGGQSHGTAQGPTTTPVGGTPATTTSPTGSSATSATPAPTASASPSSDAIQWTGPVRIAESGPRLDLAPPQMAGSGQADVWLGLINPPRISDSSYGTYPPNLALWTDSTKTPTRQECADQVSTQGTRRVEAKVGSVLCVRTDGGRIAALTITSISNDFGTGVQAQAIVWSAVSN